MSHQSSTHSGKQLLCMFLSCKTADWPPQGQLQSIAQHQLHCKTLSAFVQHLSSSRLKRCVVFTKYRGEPNILPEHMHRKNIQMAMKILHIGVHFRRNCINHRMKVFCDEASKFQAIHFIQLRWQNLAGSTIRPFKNLVYLCLFLKKLINVVEEFPDACGNCRNISPSTHTPMT